MGTIQRQGIQNTVVTYLGIVIGFLNLLILQPHFLTTEEIGLTRLLFNFSTLIAVFLPLGVANITIRFFPAFRNADKKHHGFFGFMMLFPVGGLIVSGLTLFLFKDFFISRYIKESALFTEYFTYVIPFSFILGVISVLNVYCFSLFKTTFPSVLNDILVRLGSMVLFSIYFLKWISLHQMIILFVGIYGIQLFVLLAYIFKVDKPGIIPNLTYLKSQNLPKILGYGFILSFASFAATGLKTLDSIFIGQYMALANVGIYTIVAFIPTVIEAPLNSLDKISSTKISHAMSMKNMVEVKDIYYKSCRYLLLIGALFFLGININIHAFLTFLPKVYSGGEKVVLIISISSLLNMALGSNGSIIFSSDKYKFGGALLVVLAILALVLNMLLIPIYGLNGAALATTLTTLVYFIARFVFIYLKFGFQPFNLKSFYTLALMMLCFLVNKFIPVFDFAILDILLRSTVVTSIFISGVYLLKIVPEFHSFIPFLSSEDN